VPTLMEAANAERVAVCADDVVHVRDGAEQHRAVAAKVRALPELAPAPLLQARLHPLLECTTTTAHAKDEGWRDDLRVRA